MKGVYKLRNIYNDKIYVGSSKDIDKRFKSHIWCLKNNKHRNSYLQNSYNKYGGGFLELSVLEETEDLLNREKHWISCLNPEYNIGAVGGGDNFTNHPDKERIRQVLAGHLRNCRKAEPRYGSDNPNWRGGSTKCKCGKTISSVNQSCRKCRDYSGENNSFYGKSHSYETKSRLSELRKGSVGWDSQVRGVIAGGVKFRSVADCARYHGVVPATVLYRIGKDHYDFWYVDN